MSILVLPAVEYRQSFMAAMQENREIEGLTTHHEMVIPHRPQDFAAFVARLHARETNPLKPGYITDTIFWAVVNGEYVGTLGLRHDLNDFLRQFGGHIGYRVRPSRRREGWATAMLKAALDHARQQFPDRDRLLITCDDDNIGSQRVIEKNGGQLMDVIKLDFRDRPTMRWWLPLR
jgi:predicted acetyltransferase